MNEPAPVCPACGAVENGFLFYKLPSLHNPAYDLVECGDCYTAFSPEKPIEEGKKRATKRSSVKG